MSLDTCTLIHTWAKNARHTFLGLYFKNTFLFLLRQVLAHSKRLSAKELCEKIGKFYFFNNCYFLASVHVYCIRQNVGGSFILLFIHKMVDLLSMHRMKCLY